MGVLALTFMARGFAEVALKQYLWQVDFCQSLIGRITATANKGE